MHQGVVPTRPVAAGPTHPRFAGPANALVGAEETLSPLAREASVEHRFLEPAPGRGGQKLSSEDSRRAQSPTEPPAGVEELPPGDFRFESVVWIWQRLVHGNTFWSKVRKGLADGKNGVTRLQWQARPSS